MILSSSQDLPLASSMGLLYIPIRGPRFLRPFIHCSLVYYKGKFGLLMDGFLNHGFRLTSSGSAKLSMETRFL